MTIETNIPQEKASFSTIDWNGEMFLPIGHLFTNLNLGLKYCKIVATKRIAISKLSTSHASKWHGLVIWSSVREIPFLVWNMMKIKNERLN